MSNPAQNGGPCPVIVKLSNISSICGSAAKVKSHGTVSSFSSSAAGYLVGISRTVAGDVSTSSPGSPIKQDVPVLRADHPICQASVSGVWRVAQRRFS